MKTEILFENEICDLVLVLIRLYLKTRTQSIGIIIEELLETIFNFYSVQNRYFEFIFTELSVYFRRDLMLTRDETVKYLTILKILYGEKLNVMKPRNFLYFNQNGGIRIKEKRNDEEKLKLTNVLNLVK